MGIQVKFISPKLISYIKIFYKISSPGKLPWTHPQLNTTSLLLIFYFIIFGGSSLLRLYFKLRRNSYLGIDKTGDSLIYILSVSHWACWQQIQFSVMTVVENSTGWNINTFNHKGELMTCSGCLEMHLHVDLSQPGNYAKYLKQ